MDVREVVELESKVVEEVQDGSPVSPITKPEETAQSNELTLPPSTSVDAFVTPSESPMQEASLNTNTRGTTDSASAEALGTAISDDLSKSEGDRANEGVEPPTPTHNSVGFSSSKPAQPDDPVASSVKAS
jgi:hypothetical protein